MTNPIRVVIADDHPVVRKGIRQFLERAVDIQVIGEAATGIETQNLVEELLPDILLLDMELPDISGVEVARHLQQIHSPVKIIVISAHDDPIYVRQLMEAGALGYLVKEEASEMIINAIRGVAQGEEGWVSRSIAARMASWVRGEEEGKIKFTEREMDVLRLVCDGKTNQNIAVRLGISEKTVEKYLFSVFQKLGVASRTEAAVFAVRGGLV